MTACKTSDAVRALGAIALAAALVLGGLAACALPISTQVLSTLFSDAETSPYTRAQLTEAALVTRDYTVGSHDADALQDMLDDLESSIDEDAQGRGLAPVDDETRTLTSEAISHLDDVWRVIQPAYVAFGFACALAAACAVVLHASGDGRRLGSMLTVAGAAVLAAFVLAGAWAAVDFNGLFAFFHSLFFAAGTWTFSYDSLLICMYPLAFWTGMGMIWLATTVTGCLVCIMIGRLISRTVRAS